MRHAAIQEIHEPEGETGKRSVATTGSGLHPEWERLIGPTLTTDEVRDLLRLTSTRQVAKLTASKSLLAVPTRTGTPRYPAFQFTADGRVKPEIQKIVQIFNVAPEPETPYLIASWLKSPKIYLGGQTPVEWLDLGKDADPVIVCAEESAARLAF
jgi:hypothetical protein